MKKERILTLKPVLFVMMGLPGAGKTHTGNLLSEVIRGFHIEADEFRFELFDEPERTDAQDQVVNRLSMLLLEKFMQKRINVVYDADSNKRITRKRTQQLAKKYGYEVLLIWVQTDVDTAFSRASKRDRRRQDEKHGVTVDENTFERLLSQLQSPKYENFAVVSGKHVFSTQLNTVKKKLTELGLLAVEKKQEVFTPRQTQVVSMRQSSTRRRITPR